MYASARENDARRIGTHQHLAGVINARYVIDNKGVLALPQREIRVAIAGVGNCANSLVQGLFYYRHQSSGEVPGLMHQVMGAYAVTDLVPVAAFDVDARKVGRDLSEAIFAPPNCAYEFAHVPNLGVEVMMGPVLDGVPPHLARFVEIADKAPVNVTKVLKETRTDVLVIVLPTGSKEAVRHYVDACIEAGVAFVNGIPELVVSSNEYAKKATAAKVPMVGDDFKSQLGATILHRTLVDLFVDRGVKINKSYQLNYAGNTDFENLVKRGETKHVTKVGAVKSQVPYEIDMSAGFAFVENMGDTKTAIILLEGEKFGGAPVRVEAKLTVEDSPNSAGVLIDAIRSCKIALDRGVGGPLTSASAYLMKHPPQQFRDEEARAMLEEFIAGERER